MGFKTTKNAARAAILLGLASLAGTVQAMDLNLPEGVTPTARPPRAADVIVAFCRDAATLRTGLAGWGEAIFPAGMVWVAWPRKAAGHVSDVDENLIRDSALALGLVDVKVAALDHDWSGLKVVWRKENRTR